MLSPSLMVFMRKYYNLSMSNLSVWAVMLYSVPAQSPFAVPGKGTVDWNWDAS